MGAGISPSARVHLCLAYKSFSVAEIVDAKTRKDSKKSKTKTKTVSRYHGEDMTAAVWCVSVEYLTPEALELAGNTPEEFKEKLLPLVTCSLAL